MADDAESSNMDAGPADVERTSGDADITNNPIVEKAKRAGELARQIFLEACATEMSNASEKERQYFDLQARKVGNELYMTELQESVDNLQEEKQQVKELIRDIEDETKEIEGEIEQLKSESNE